MSKIIHMPRITVPTVLLGAIATALLLSCSKTASNNQPTPDKQRPVKIVSWGGQFQDDMRVNWWQPAAQKCGVDFESGSWDGDYGALSSRIRKGINDWDLVHVEAHYVKSPEAASLFESFPARKLTRVNPQLKNEFAVPILEYGYVLAYRTDLFKAETAPNWTTFFDPQAVPGHRALRDFPVGNIEIALISKGYNVEETLYSSALPRAQVEQRVDEALQQFDRIKPSIIWWTSGDQLQRILTGGEAPLTAAWSGRVWSAHKQLCPNVPLENCSLKANEQTSLVSTDWWIIPKNAPNARRANDFLECMYSENEAITGAQKFQFAQGYALPLEGLQIEDPVARYYLGLGSSANTKVQGRIQEEFWSTNFEWINARWLTWRSR